MAEERTLELTPGEARAAGPEAALAPRLEVLHHADLRRVGASLTWSGGRPLAVGRRAPDLDDGEPLADLYVSRDQLTVRWQAGAFEVAPSPAARLPLLREDGSRVQGPVRVPPGTPLALGDRALLLLDAVPPGGGDDLGLIGESAPVRALRERIRTFARFRETVLVLGETGTGKELVARALHRLGGADGAFVALNMGGLDAQLCNSELFGHVRGAFTDAHRDRPGAFELARGGTLFLDEIGELPPDLQKKLLRVLETRQFAPVGATREQALDCRVLAATHRPLNDDVAAGLFRLDLLERLNGLSIAVPPLRARRGDVPRLFFAFLREQAEAHPELRRFWAPPAANAAPAIPLRFVLDLVRHPWPGNVRSLRNFATATAAHNLTGGAFVAPDLPPGAPAPEPAGSSPQRSVPSVEAIEGALAACRGNVRQAAARLGASRHQLYRWMTAHGLDVERYRDA